MAERGELVPVRITLIEKRGKCHYDPGKTFEWRAGWKGPEKVCTALDWAIGAGGRGRNRGPDRPSLAPARG